MKTARPEGADARCWRLFCVSVLSSRNRKSREKGCRFRRVGSPA